jgi:hypothetical protein
MALSNRTLQLAKYCYWILLTIAHLYICYILFVTDRVIAGVLWLVMGFLMIAVFFPVFFPPGNPGARWPPYISPCPDYMTQIAPGVCADFVGLNSAIKKSDPKNPPVGGDATRVFTTEKDMQRNAINATNAVLSWQGVN